MYFVDLEKAFDRVPMKVLECTMRKKGIPDVLVMSVICLYREQRQVSKWIPSCQKSLGLMWGCTNNLCYHHLFLQLW